MKMVKKSDTDTAPALLMYIGPTLRTPVPLTHRSVFSGGIPAFAKDLTGKDNDLAGCFVPLAEAGKALRELEGYPGTVAGEHSRRFAAVRKHYEVK
jgi:hypothetical protein